MAPWNAVDPVSSPSTVVVHASLRKAPPELVWKLLVEAENWSSYFPPEDQVKLPDGEEELKLGRVDEFD